MMKLAVFFALLSVAFAVTVRPAANPSPAAKPSPAASPSGAAPQIKKPDISVQLDDGSTTTASGDQAVGTAANKDSGATGAKGSDNAIGLAGPGFAFGFGQGSGPDATPGFGSILNIFN